MGRMPEVCQWRYVMLFWILLLSVTNQGEAKWDVFVVYNEQKSKTKNVPLKAGLFKNFACR